MLATIGRNYFEDKEGSKAKDLFGISIMLIAGGTDADVKQDKIDLERLLVNIKNSGTVFIAPNPVTKSLAITVCPVSVEA